MRFSLLSLGFSLLACTAALPVAALAEDLDANTKAATVFIATYNTRGDFMSWGSGFFVDEGIVVTNEHVIDDGAYYRVFTVNDSGTADTACYQTVTKSDMRISLEDDVAYIRVFVSCPHGIVQFADDDPVTGETIRILGFPTQGTLKASLNLKVVDGKVTGATTGPWLTTDAAMDHGHSGGPVVQGGLVVGVAVAKTTDRSGNYINGLFVPVSIVRRGLEYANDSSFAYTPQARQGNAPYQPAVKKPTQYGKADDPFDPLRSSSVANNGACTQSLGSGGEATGYGGCKCKKTHHKDAAGTKCLPGAEGWEDPYRTLTTRRVSTETTKPVARFTRNRRAAVKVPTVVRERVSKRTLRARRAETR